MAREVEKVLVYVTRGREVLAFDHRDHPEAGVQVPAGTVEPGESVADAGLRELREEAGLELSGGRLVGRFDWYRADRDELHFRNVFHFLAPPALRESWLHTVKGEGEDQDLVFRFRWLPIEEAKIALAAAQGSYLDLL